MNQMPFLEMLFMSVWIGDKWMQGIKEGVSTTLNRIWQAQNDGVWPRNQDAMLCAHTHKNNPQLKTVCVCVPHARSIHTCTPRHGKVGTSMRGQFDLFHRTQIHVCGSIFEIRTHKQTPSPNQLGFLRQGQNKVIWACEWPSQPGCDSQDSCY